MMDYDQFSRDDFIGKLMIPLSKLSDQNKHEDWFNMYEKDGILSKTQLFLSLHWVHSRVKFLSEIVRKWDEHVQLEEEEIKFFQEDLYTLYQPFSRLRKVIDGQEQASSQNNNGDMSRISKSSSKRSRSGIEFEERKVDKSLSEINPPHQIRQSPFESDQEKNLKRNLNISHNQSPDLSRLREKRPEEYVAENIWSSKELRNCKIGFFFFLLIACFVCFARAAFLEVEGEIKIYA